MNRRNGQIGVMDRSEALHILGISKEQDEEFQAQFINGGRPKKLPVKKTSPKMFEKLEKEKNDLSKRVEVLEENIRLIKNFLCI